MNVFEWDKDKNKQNIQKHELSFTDAWEVFQKPMLVLKDMRKEYFEERYIGMGYLKNRLIYRSPMKMRVFVSHGFFNASGILLNLRGKTKHFPLKKPPGFVPLEDENRIFKWNGYSYCLYLSFYEYNQNYFNA